MRSLYYTHIVLALLFLFFNSCKKNPIPDPIISVSINDTNKGFEFNASISDLANSDLLETGFVWSDTENPAKISAFSYVTAKPQTAFNYTVIAGFSKGKRYFLRAYYVDQQNQIHYSDVVAFDGKNTIGADITIAQKNYTWGDEIEIKILDTNLPDLNASNIILNESIRIKPSRITSTSVFFFIPLTIHKLQNSVSLELYNQIGRNAYFIMQHPRIENDVPIVSKIGAVVKINGNYFNPTLDSNIVMIGTKRLEVLSASPQSLTFKLPENDLAYSGNFSIQTGTGLKTISSTISKVYKYLSPIGEFPGTARFRGMVESINGKIYCGFGSDIDTRGLNDFYEYTPASSTWRKMGDFPATLYGAGLSFTTKNQLFFIPNAMDNTYNNNVYKFDFNNNKWSKISEYPGTRLLHYTVFGGDRYAYMLGGEYSTPTNYVITVKSFKRFDPETNTWKDMPDFPGTSRRAHKSVKVGNKVIVFGGQSMWGDGKRLLPTDCWAFDLVEETWKQIKNVPTYINVDGSFVFELNGKAYLGGGSDPNSVISSDIYEYDPVADIFTKKDQIIDNAMLVTSSAASADGHGYILFGKSSYESHLPPLKGLFSFLP